MNIYAADSGTVTYSGWISGKNVNWSQSTLTVSLAGDRPNGSVTGTPDSAAKAQTVQAAIRPDITILVDNVRQTFADANGDTVYPLLYSGSVYLPHHYPRNSVVYVGTHDNDTALGWLASITPEDAAYARAYLRLNDPDGEVR